MCLHDFAFHRPPQAPDQAKRAVRGLGIRRAEVLGQLFRGIVSVFRPVEAAPEAVGVPYVVFAGNVGDENTLAEVIETFGGEA